MEWIALIAGLLAYTLACRLVMRQLGGTWREVAFAGLNLAGVYGFLFYGHQSHYTERFIFYLGLIFSQYIMLVAFSEKQGGKPWLAFFTPIAALIVVRYIPGSFYVELGHIFGAKWKGVPDMVGISYLAFRSSRLVLEVRNGAVKRPNFWEYLNFCFFLPTMPVGPINSYGNFRRGFEAVPLDFPLGRCTLRILVGFVKFEFLGVLCNQLTYSALLLDDHPHHWIDLPAAILFFYLYLYCNFSGFCDMAIGAAGLIGIPVPENFDNPFAARNVKDFWNRWHITLSQYMRDVVFGPLSKFFAHALGHAYVDHAIALTIAVVFLLMGIWHGAGWNFVAYGAVHALGVVANHYYTIALKKRLGREGFKAYNANPWIHAVAVVLTFCYCATSLFLFANTFPGMREILSLLR
jgi:D-alanyl-lipoteichoic acid acyltransferase DltB (MBOAT superfamily)